MGEEIILITETFAHGSVAGKSAALSLFSPTGFIPKTYRDSFMYLLADSERDKKGCIVTIFEISGRFRYRSVSRPSWMMAVSPYTLPRLRIGIVFFRGLKRGQTERLLQCRVAWKHRS
jgi:hypothetical protein